MKVAVTGGTGFVGRHLGRALLADQHEVTLVARGAANVHVLVGLSSYLAVDPREMRDGLAPRERSTE
jgi:uncharacterized protein YbjT (DUF2867 family)